MQKLSYCKNKTCSFSYSFIKFYSDSTNTKNILKTSKKGTAYFLVNFKSENLIPLENLRKHRELRKTKLNWLAKI